ncbi:uncharacterized protein Z520_02943 [Fonsecaea multimorphosa CBS 102226]|uniref:Uncharacterized protein n=1 Tax=Fonsecaea multimorphosa CBS 102226 TaxID=1442371 RepID=A0A0D2HHM2_9EURO|nr:uncharacterized protein Z520_02943 [Fonsecaea multimorphosa CBS 102226]KIY01391.1 hypothetical protein Z520_02943 [Fonsecaea multimorphosa CBS 102226]OAL28408.1 hypothetical protein AYO22_02862 [Fonsecaea multimorphosa]
MTAQKRDITAIEGTEEPPGKRHHRDLTKALLTTPNSLLGDYPAYSPPQPDFLSVFSRIAPFVDGLRECGGLDRYDYTRLRMTCKTTAQEWKPYPYDRCEPDTQDRYFAGLQAIPCSDCGVPSDRLVVKPCYGLGPWKADGFSGCNKLVCAYCVVKALRAHGPYRNVGNELHYCQPCSWNLCRTSTQALAHECQCTFHHSGDIVDQPDPEWQCTDCRVTLLEKLSNAARDNLMIMETQQHVVVRDERRHPFAAGGLERWINPDHENRNHCPGCGIHYIDLVQTWEDDAEWDEMGYWHADMVRRCASCLGLKCHAWD